jgi:hypothetical protein
MLPGLGGVLAEAGGAAGEAGGAFARYNSVLAVEIFIVALIGILGYQMRDRLLGLCEPDPAEAAKRKVVRSGQNYGAWGERLAPLGRALGVADYTMEVSELHVGNADCLALVGAVYLTIQVGRGETAQTSDARPREDVRFVRFGEVFQVSIGKIDSPCLIALHDRDDLTAEPVATVEVPARQFIDMAFQRTEFFRLDLHAKAHRLLHGRSDSGGEATLPFVALRIRQTAGPGQQQSMAKNVDWDI